MAEHVWQDYRLNSSTAARYYFPSTSTTYCENSAFVCQACAAERFFKSISTTGPACVWTSPPYMRTPSSKAPEEDAA
ncbi:hypothetical protein PR002_g24466 [Phytophthora rubi]|uniref:Uncharacterized protein n=1 Tax=Phytophthora rubi TaxID=129364 RepID=A0A6A3ICT3_9STRA|nr:hypothetical protein PR002_g24466 [Phytophthora rubi]